MTPTEPGDPLTRHTSPQSQNHRRLPRDSDRNERRTVTRNRSRSRSRDRTSPRRGSRNPERDHRRRRSRSRSPSRNERRPQSPPPMADPGRESVRSDTPPPQTLLHASIVWGSRRMDGWMDGWNMEYGLDWLTGFTLWYSGLSLSSRQPASLARVSLMTCSPRLGRWWRRGSSLTGSVLQRWHGLSTLSSLS